MKLTARFRCLVLAVVLGTAPAAGFAQARTFKDATRLGTLEVLVFPQARLDGREVLLAPGAKIFNTDNTLAMPATVKGQVPVRYRVDNLGQVNEAWILTADELRQAQRESAGGAQPARSR